MVFCSSTWPSTSPSLTPVAPSPCTATAPVICTLPATDCAETPAVRSPTTETVPALTSEPFSRVSTEIPAESLPSMEIAPPRLLRMSPLKASGPVTRTPKRADPCANGPSRSPSLSASAGV